MTTEAVARLSGPAVQEILAQALPFSTLTRSQRGHIAQLSEFVDYPSQCEMYKLGDSADCCYVLVRGVVRFKLQLGDRWTPAGDLIRSGELFGWAAVVRDARRRMGTGSCMTACTVLAINGDKLLQLMDDDNAIGYAVMSHVNLLITSTLTSLAAG
ncbi:MAG: cyclic nucleotide-binding domain-containing protein [Casimicrobiaceae bacterium]